MNNTFLIRFSAIAAALSLVAIASTAAAGGLPQPHKFLSLSARKTASAASGRTTGDRNGKWIAYSTAPAGDASRGWGSDVFVARAGGSPVLVASRDIGIWNVCPVFSPNGRMLAFVRSSGRQLSSGVGFARETIAVVPIGDRGDNVPIAGGWRVLKVPSGPVRCPSWSSDSSRLAYVDRGRVVVRGLDGSRLQWADGDPTIHDFERSRRDLVSPTGDLVASMSTPGIVVSRPDGSDRRVIKQYLYAIAGWSPDGRKLLVMSDEGGGFMMRAVSVAAPFTSTRIVDFVRVNNPRSWPGYGDVSWQPIPRR